MTPNVSITGPRVLAWTLLLATLSACGTAEYEQRMEKTAQEIGQVVERRREFDEALHGSSAIGDTAVEIRVPNVFQASYQEGSSHPIDGQIDPRRFQPPFLSLPGHQLTYEAEANNAEEVPRPYYYYLAVTDGDPAQLRSGLLAELKKTFPDTPAGWENFEAQTPEGDTVSWKRIQVAGPQQFPGFARGRFVQEDGIFALYHFAEGEQNVLVGWRIPQAVASKVDMERLARLTAGSVRISG